MLYFSAVLHGISDAIRRLYKTCVGQTRRLKVETFTCVISIHILISSGKSKGRNQGLYYLYLEAISVRNLKSNAVSDEEIRASGISNFQTCSDRDLEFVVKYKEQHGPDVFRQMLQSFCPSIYGHELVKGTFFLLILYYVNKVFLTVV